MPDVATSLGAVLASARRNWLVWFVVLPVGLWALIRLFGLDSGFPLATMMAFTPYVAVVALLVAGIAVALENWVAATVGTLAALCLAALVLPRAIGDGTVEAAGRETIGVLSANVHHGTADAAELIALVERLDPDVLAIQELTPSFAAELERAGLGERLPEAVLKLERGASGSGIYADLPLRDRGEVEPTPFPFRMPRAEVEMPDGRRVRLVDVHPYPPGRGHIGVWEAALESLPPAGRGAPWVLAGDFNATLDQSELRAILDRGYRDAGDVAGEGLEPTWPDGDFDHPLPPVTIDHVLADRRLDIVEYSVEDLPGTDHHPVYTVLVLP